MCVCCTYVYTKLYTLTFSRWLLHYNYYFTPSLIRASGNVNNYVDAMMFGRARWVAICHGFSRATHVDLQRVVSERAIVCVCACVCMSERDTVVFIHCFVYLSTAMYNLNQPRLFRFRICSRGYKINFIRE